VQRLGFNNDLSSNDQVSSVPADHHATEDHFEGHLSLHPQAGVL